MQTVTAPLPDCKACSKCKSVLPREFFYLRPGRKLGTLMSWCKPCMVIEKRKRYKADPEKHREKTAQWRKANPIKVKEMGRAAYASNVEEIRRRAREYCKANKDKRKAYRHRNAERIKERNAKYRAGHKAEISAYQKAYQEKNRAACTHHVVKCMKAKPALYREIHRGSHDRRRARILSLPTETFRNSEIFARDNWTCHLCKGPVDPDLKYPNPMSASLDHVVPIARGGSHTRGNVACSHLKCNVIKNARSHPLLTA